MAAGTYYCRIVDQTGDALTGPARHTPDPVLQKLVKTTTIKAEHNTVTIIEVLTTLRDNSNSSICLQNFHI